MISFNTFFWTHEIIITGTTLSPLTDLLCKQAKKTTFNRSHL